MKTEKLRATGIWKLVFLMTGLSMAIVLPLNAQTIDKNTNEAIPSVDAEILVPRIKKNNEALLIAFRHTHPGYLEQKNFDTDIYRFETDDSGKIKNSRLSNRMIGGEILVGEYFAIPGGMESRIVSVFDGEIKTIARIISIPDGFMVEGEGWNKKYRKNSVTSFTVEEELFSGISSATWDNSGVFTALIQVDGNDHSKGFFYDAATGKFIYGEYLIKDSSLLARYNIQVWKSGDDYRIRLDDIEPTGEFFCDGVGSVFGSNKNALYNFVFLDILLRCEGKISPLLVLFFFGKI